MSALSESVNNFRIKREQERSAPEITPYTPPEPGFAEAFLGNLTSGLYGDFSSAVKGLGARVKAIDEVGRESSLDEDIRNGSKQTVLSDIGDYLVQTGQAGDKIVRRLNAGYGTAPEYADKDMYGRLTDPGYLTNPRGLWADTWNGVGSSLPFMAAALAGPEFTMPGKAIAAIGSKAEPIVNLLPGFGQKAASALLGSGAQRAANEMVKAGTLITPLDAFINSSEMYDELKEQGKTDREASAIMNEAALSEVPVDFLANAVFGGVVSGGIGNAIAGNGARIGRRALSGLSGIPLEMGTEYVQEALQQRNNNRYLGKPHGEGFNFTPEERAVGAAAALGSILPSAAGAVRTTFTAPNSLGETNADEEGLESVFDTGHGDIDRIVSDAARRYGLSPQLIHKVIQQESGYNPEAVSDAGAQGLMQLMPGTAQGLGVSDSFDPEQNINGGAKYLRQMLDEFDGDVRKALAAYNAGPNNIEAGYGYADEVLGRSVDGTEQASEGNRGWNPVEAASDFFGKRMDNGKNGCVEAVTKIGAAGGNPFLADQLEKGVVYVPTLVENAGDMVIPFDASKLQAGDVIVYGDDDHVVIYDGNGGYVGNSSSQMKVIHGDDYTAMGEDLPPTKIIKTGGQGGSAPIQQSASQMGASSSRQQKPVDTYDNEVNSIYEGFIREQLKASQSQEDKDFFGGFFDKDGNFEATKENISKIEDRINDDLAEDFDKYVEAQETAGTGKKPQPSKPEQTQIDVNTESIGRLRELLTDEKDKAANNGDSDTVFNISKTLATGNEQAIRQLAGKLLPVTQSESVIQNQPQTAPQVQPQQVTSPQEQTPTPQVQQQATQDNQQEQPEQPIQNQQGEIQQTQPQGTPVRQAQDNFAQNQVQPQSTAVQQQPISQQAQPIQTQPTMEQRDAKIIQDAYSTGMGAIPTSKKERVKQGRGLAMVARTAGISLPSGMVDSLRNGNKNAILQAQDIIRNSGVTPSFGGTMPLSRQALSSVIGGEENESTESTKTESKETGNTNNKNQNAKPEQAEKAQVGEAQALKQFKKNAAKVVSDYRKDKISYDEAFNKIVNIADKATQAAQDAATAEAIEDEALKAVGELNNILEEKQVQEGDTQNVASEATQKDAQQETPEEEQKTTSQNGAGEVKEDTRKETPSEEVKTPQNEPQEARGVNEKKQGENNKTEESMREEPTTAEEIKSITFTFGEKIKESQYETVYTVEMDTKPSIEAAKRILKGTHSRWSGDKTLKFNSIEAANNFLTRVERDFGAKVIKQADKYNGFLKGMTPAAQARADKTLSKTERYNGKISSRGKIVEGIIESGGHAESRGNTYRIYTAKGTFVEVTKIEHDYAKFLEGLRTSDTQEETETDTNQTGKGQESKPNKETEDTTKEYKYYMNERGVSPGAQPKGFTRFDEEDKGGRYGAIYYDHPLTEQEITDYELTPAEGEATGSTFGDEAENEKAFLESLGITEDEEEELSFGDEFGDTTDEEIEALKDELKKELSKLSANPAFNPKIYTLGLQLGGKYIKKGYRTFKKWLAKMTGDLGGNIEPWAPAIWETLKTYPKGQKFDPKQVMACSKLIGSKFERGVTSLDDINADMKKLLKGRYKEFAPMIEASYNGIEKYFSTVKEGKNNVTDSTGGLASRTGERDNQNAVGRNDESGRPGGRNVREGGKKTGNEVQQQDSTGIRNSSTTRSGETGNSRVQAEESEDRADSAGSAELSGSVRDSYEGSVALDDGRKAEDIVSAEERRDNEGNKEVKQKNVAYKAGDLDSIRADLPMLLPEQQKDVQFIENRLLVNDGTGVLLTNGTGTGKTYSGLGMVKRFANSGKKNMLIVVPSEEVAKQWQEAAKNDFGLDVKPLESVKDNGGKGICVTTYANFQQNKELAMRDWDAVIADESHNLMQNKDGEKTGYLTMLRALTKHPREFYERFKLQNRTKTIRKLENEIDGWKRDIQKLEKAAKDKSIKEGAAHERIEKLQAKIRDNESAISNEYSKMDDKWKEVEKELQATDPKERPKVLFLSATPFAYDKCVDYAEGYLFDYPAESDGGYNAAGGRDKFMIQNFGYRMRYNKLTRPDSQVDNRVMEVQFHDNLVNSGVMHGRQIDIDADYDRGFILVNGGIGTKIDEGFRWLREQKKYRELEEALSRQFRSKTKKYLLESIKAQAAIPLVREYLKNGKKVVLFHQVMKEKTNVHPFVLKGVRARSEEEADKIRQQWESFKAERPDLVKLNLNDIPSPMETFRNAFGDDALYVDGSQEHKKGRKTAQKFFNDDNSGRNIIICQQDAANAGISLHDTTGKHPRVLINIAMPERPIYAMQIEGRIYRVGNKSNAVFRYLATGTDMEKDIFANTIGTRAETAENLAQGQDARGLHDSFTNLYMETMDGSWVRRKPGHEEEGTGGKEMDFSGKEDVSDWQRAISFYFGQQKKTSKNKAAEGKDYFATPEPIGLKMVQWLGLKDGDSVLEPSAGHGAISRWFSPNTSNTIVEPSGKLAPIAQMVTPEAKVVQSNFEDFNVVNKFDGIAMNPPFGSGGKTAVDHIAKAFRHLRDGGRLVAIIPTGPAADAHFNKWFYGENKNGEQVQDPIKGGVLTADIRLPSVTFNRAGTGVATRIVVIDKQNNAGREQMAYSRGGVSVDLTNVKDINELFERMENMTMPERVTFGYPKEYAKTIVSQSEKPAQNGTVNFEAGSFRHTKTGEMIPQAKLKDGSDSERNKRIAQLAKNYGGKWSRYSKSLLFKSEAKRDEFLNAAEALLASTDPETMAKLSITAWHGSPHKFDSFSLQSIGTGEGAQVHGYGLYFAKERVVGETYRETLRANKNRVLVNGEVWQKGKPDYNSPVWWAASSLQSARYNADKAAKVLRDAAAKKPKGVSQDELNAMTEAALLLENGSVTAAENKGSLFQVEIPDEDVMLDEQKKLSEQPEKVRNLLEAYAEEIGDYTFTFDEMDKSDTGRSFYRYIIDFLGSPKAASEYLNKAGVKGITYNGGRDGRCYVVFDDQAIDIIERFSAEAMAESEIRRMMMEAKVVDNEKLTSQQRKLSALGEELGSPVIWMDGDSRLHGWHQNGFTFLNVNSKADIEKTFWHETFHWIRSNNKQNYAQIVKEVQESDRITKKQMDKWRKKTGRFDLSDEDVIEEMLCDSFYDAAGRVKELRTLANNNPSLAQRVMAWIKRLADRFNEFMHGREGGLTTSQRDNLTRVVGKLAATMKDGKGRPIFGVYRNGTEIRLANGQFLPAVSFSASGESTSKTNNRDEASSAPKFSYSSSDNSTPPLTQRIRNILSGVPNNDQAKEMYRRTMARMLEDALDVKIRTGKTDFPQGETVIYKEKDKVIRSLHAYDWENILPVAGGLIAERLGISDKASKTTPEMKNYIADWILTGAANNTSPEARQFQKAMANHPAYADKLIGLRTKFQDWMDKTAQEKMQQTVQWTKGKSLSWKERKDLLYEQFVEELAPIEKLVQNFEKATGKKLEDIINPMTAFRLFRGSYGRAITMIEGIGDAAVDGLRMNFPGVDFTGFKTLRTILADIGALQNQEKQKDFGTYCIACHMMDMHKSNKNLILEQKNLERWIQEIKDGKRQGDEATIKEYEKAIEELKADIYETPPQFSLENCEMYIRNGKKKYDEAQKALVRFSNVTAAILANSGVISYKHYTDLLKKWPNYVPLFRVFEENENIDFGDSMKKLAGSTRDIINPIESIIHNTVDFIKKAEKNKAKCLLADLARCEGSGWLIEEVDNSKPNTKTTVTFYENGVRKYLETDPAIVEAINNMDRSNSNTLMKFIHAITAMARACFTIASPEFAVRNVFRDYADMTVYNKFGFVSPADWVRGLIHAMNRDSTYYEWLSSGAAMASAVSLDRNYTQEMVDKLNRSWGRRFASKQFGKALLEALQKVGEYSEYATRISMYEKAKKATMKNQKADIQAAIVTAALQSRDLMDFSRHGKAGEMWNKWVPFANASLQGMNKFYRTMFDPKQYKNKKELAWAWARLALSSVLPAMVLFLAHHDDDWYKEAPDWLKETHWLFKIGDTVIRIPKGSDVGIRFISNAVEKGMAEAYGEDKYKLLDYFKPVIDGIPDIFPIILKPMTEAMLNKSFFTKRNIVPQYQEKLPAKLQYGPYTTGLSKVLGEALGIAPSKIDHVLSGYTGSLGMAIPKAIDLALGTQQLDIAPTELPLTRSITYMPYKNPRSVQKFYELLDEQTKYENEYKMTKKRPEELDSALLERLKATKKHMTKLSKEEKDVINNPNLTLEQRKKRQMDIQQKRINLVKQVVK